MRVDNDKISFHNSGDSAIFCRLTDKIDLSASRNIIALHRKLNFTKPVWFIESVPSYTGLMIYFKALLASPDTIRKNILSLYNEVLMGSAQFNCRLLRIPVCYEGAYAPDLDIVASGAALSREDVIRLHSESDYIVYMLGFTPGFPYMGGMNRRISTPRKAEPRLKIMAGSIGIAGDQTGIYPIESPGGWQIIGRTPLQLYKPSAKDPFLFRAGDCVNFTPVTLADYFRIGEAVRTGKYKPEIIDEHERNKDY